MFPAICTARVVTVLALCALTAACQSGGKTELSEQPTKQADSHANGPTEATVNVIAYIDMSFITGFRRFPFGNGSYMDTFVFRDHTGQGSVITTYSAADSPRPDSASYWTEAGFRSGNTSEISDIRDIKEIHHNNTLVGYRGTGTLTSVNEPCIIDRAAYNLSGLKTNGADDFDTTVYASFCSQGQGQDPDPSRIDSRLSGLDLVHDRGAYRAALRARAEAADVDSHRLPLPRKSILMTRNLLAFTWPGAKSNSS
jgi:hypothetical protein